MYIWDMWSDILFPMILSYILTKFHYFNIDFISTFAEETLNVLL